MIGSLFMGCFKYQYIPYDGVKFGYRDGQLSDDTFWAEYNKRGGRFNEKYTLLRCAEITKKNDFKYFVVLKKVNLVIDQKVNNWGRRYTFQCYTKKPSNLDFNALDNYAIIYEADMVIKNYQYLYNKEEAKKRVLEE